MTYLSGFHAIEERVNAGKGRAGTLLVATPGPRIKKILELAERRGVTVRRLSQAELDRLAPGNRGAALAVDEEPSARELDLDEWLAAGVPETCLVVVLDHIEDPHNLGAVLRSADVFAADLVILPQRRAAKETDVVARASAGASAYVPVATVTNLPRALGQLKDAGFWTYAADMGGKPVRDANFSGRVALVMGAEGGGVSRLVAETCDYVLSIPQFGHVDSLNVSVAAGILLYEARGRLGPPKA